MCACVSVFMVSNSAISDNNNNNKKMDKVSENLGMNPTAS